MTSDGRHEDVEQRRFSARGESSSDQACESKVQIISASHFPTSARLNSRVLGRRAKVEIREEEVLAAGSHCSVRKHVRLGCAVVHFKSETLREAVMLYFQQNYKEEMAAWRRSDLAVTVQQHFDRTSNDYDRLGLYVNWGREMEKTSPIPVQFIRERFDHIVGTILSLGRKNCAPPPDQLPLSRFFQECGDAVCL
eukprot:TRINITY_DN11625_c0_g1_i2.p1 TRINITY_DN11625_c0_g1~~TRINITY_DN11625_c0_g1_i2.p1  ORF type:complete len:224 (-),score=18.78 TRINITY_DN11625_c0_g1_i2:331-915(-)